MKAFRTYFLSISHILWLNTTICTIPVEIGKILWDFKIYRWFKITRLLIERYMNIGCITGMTVMLWLVEKSLNCWKFSNSSMELFEKSHTQTHIHFLSWYQRNSKDPAEIIYHIEYLDFGRTPENSISTM